MEYATQLSFFYGRSGFLRYQIQNMIKIGPYYGTRLSFQNAGELEEIQEWKDDGEGEIEGSAKATGKDIYISFE